MNKITLYEGDNRISLKRMIERGELVDSVVCDPPYGLKSIIKRFGKEGSAPAKYHRDGAFARASKGFMGQSWDGSEIENDPEFWKLVYRVMKPGAYLVAFSSPRTYHLMATAIELAGFVVHPMIGWCYGSGMPKAHDAAKAIDKALGKKGNDQNKDGTWEKLEDRTYQPGEYVPATTEAALFNGWAYGGQARKPALEPIFIGQKPFSTKTGAANILLHGVGAVNIDACRVATDENLNGGAYAKSASGRGGTWQNDDRSDGKGGGFKNGSGDFVQPQGRWPANMITDGSEEVEALFPKNAGMKGRIKGFEQSEKTSGIYNAFQSRTAFEPHDDRTGSAMRFFEQYQPICYECGDSGIVYHEMMCIGDSPSLEQCPCCFGLSAEESVFTGIPIFYVPKASKSDRAGTSHPTVKPIPLIQSLQRHVTPPGGTTLDPFAGSGTAGQAAINEGFRAILMENEKPYAEFIRRRLNLPLTIDDMLGEIAVPVNAEDLL